MQCQRLSYSFTSWRNQFGNYSFVYCLLPCPRLKQASSPPRCLVIFSQLQQPCWPWLFLLLPDRWWWGGVITWIVWEVTPCATPTPSVMPILRLWIAQLQICASLARHRPKLSQVCPFLVRLLLLRLDAVSCKSFSSILRQQQSCITLPFSNWYGPCAFGNDSAVISALF